MFSVVLMVCLVAGNREVPGSGKCSWFLSFFLLSFQYVQTDYHVLVEVLEPVLAVRAKEELATSLVHILHKTGHAQDFLTDIIMVEVNKLGQ